MEADRADYAHILAVPFFLKGHEIPLLHLCRHLYSLSGGRIAVTILTLSKWRHSMRDEQQDLDFVQYESLPLDAPVDRDMKGMLDFFPRFQQLGGAVAEQWRHRRVTCVMTDVLIGWGREVARELDVPWIAFWTSTMTELAVYSNFPRLIEDANGCLDAESILKIPGLPDLKVSDYMTLHYFQDPNFPAKVIIESFVEAVQCIKHADRVLANSSQSLESNAIKALELCGVNIVPVGPLHLGITTGKDHDDPNQVLQWLDAQEHRSVLYIAFGTIAPVPEAQFEEIVLALESIENISFVWVIRPEQLGLIPSGFESTARYAFKSESTARNTNGETLYRGLLTDWVPQVSVLRHRAIGGFLTHCGWNSVLEAITVGIPMATMPRMADQCLTRKILDEEWGVSVRLKNNISSVVSKAELEAAIRDLMIDRQQELRERAREIGESARQGMEEGGSSRLGMDALVKDLGLWSQGQSK